MATRIWDGAASDNTISTATNWSDDTAPGSTDSAVFPALSAAATKDVNGADFSAVLLVDLSFEYNCALNFGSRVTALHVDADYVDYAASGIAFLQIDNSTAVRVTNCGSAGSTSTYGLSLTGASNALLILDPGAAGRVGVAAMGGETAAFTTIKVNSGIVDVGDSVTCTTMAVMGGQVKVYSSLTTYTQTSGTARINAGTPTTVNLYEGTLYYNSAAAAPTTVNLYDGSLDFSEAGSLADWSSVTLNWYGGNIVDPGNVCNAKPLKKVGGTASFS